MGGWICIVPMTFNPMMLWINSQDGTFTNRIDEMLQHQSTNSIGMDIADLNNDGLPEIVNLDMMPEDNLR